MTEKQLKETFSGFGKIHSCSIITDPVSGRSKHLGYVNFLKKERAEKCCQEIGGLYSQWPANSDQRSDKADRRGASQAGDRLSSLHRLCLLHGRKRMQERKEGMCPRKFWSEVILYGGIKLLVKKWSAWTNFTV